MPDFAPAHPGEVLREDFLKPLDLSQYALAKAIGVPQIRISEIVNGKRAITPDTALRLACYFGTSARILDGYADDLRPGDGARSDRRQDQGSGSSQSRVRRDLEVENESLPRSVGQATRRASYFGSTLQVDCDCHLQ